MNNEPPNKVYWLVTTQRYAQSHRRGDNAEWRFLSEEKARDYMRIQMGTGAFCRMYLERVELVECIDWREWYPIQGKNV